MSREEVNSHNNLNADYVIYDDERSISYLEEFSEGGWGWVVVFASFMVHVLADGVTYSFGVLTTEIIAHFRASRESVGWMASILVGMTLTSGPLASILCNKFGFRTVTMVGAIISGVGFCAPFFYPEFWFLYLSASIISGLGFGLVYLPSIVTVSIYFQDRRAFATGLAVCGSGIGTFVFSPLIEFLIVTYGWQGTMLIVGGLIFNCLACGAVYRPLKIHEDKYSVCSSSKLSLKKSDINNKTHQILSPLLESIADPCFDNAPDREFRSTMNVTSILNKNSESRYTCSAPDMQKMINTSRVSKKKPLLKVSHPHLLISSQMSLHLNIQKRELSQHSKEGKVSIFSTKEIKGCIEDIFDMQLLKNPVFVLFAISNFFTSIGFNAPFLYAKDRAIEMGITNNPASFLISSIGIGNTLGRVLFGYLSTAKFVNRLFLYNISLMISGFVIMLSSFAVTYSWMIVYTLSFGILTGTYVTLTSIVLVDLLGIEKLNASFGMTMIAQGAAVFIGPPLAGWIFDMTASFDWSFWVCGGFLALSGIMLFFVYCSKDFREKNNVSKAA